MVFNELLDKNKIIFFDGAAGTEMARRGLTARADVNLTHPKEIEAMHSDYASLGIDCLITNSLTINRISIESKKLDIDVAEVNLSAARIARSAAEANQFVFGDIGPTGKLLKPYGDFSEEQFYETFKEQASILYEGGVDGIIIETMTDLREAVCALQAVKDNLPLPVIVSMSFSTTDKGGRTMMGNSVDEIAAELEKNGADIIGANCGDLTPLDMAALALNFKNSSSLPIIIQPNAGLPRLEGDQTIYDMTPQDFADGVMECIENGAALIGGCCGTTVDHIKAVVNRINQPG